MATYDEDNHSASVLSNTILMSPSDDNFGESSFPLVFFCEKCRQIVGDSNSWVCTNTDLRAISLMRTEFPLFLLAICICSSAYM